MGMVFNDLVSDKKKRRRDIIDIGITTRPWDIDRNVVFAHSVEVFYTVFHGTYTCFQICDAYNAASYHNTDPNSPPSSVGPDRLQGSSNIKPTHPQWEASPTASGSPGTTPTGSPTVGTGGSGVSTPSAGHGHNATHVSAGYYVLPSPSKGSQDGSDILWSQFKGGAAGKSVLFVWASSLVAIVALLWIM